MSKKLLKDIPGIFVRVTMAKAGKTQKRSLAEIVGETSVEVTS